LHGALPISLFDAISAERGDVPLYWSVRDRSVDVPSRGTPIVEGTAQWHRALATSRIWINNNNFPYYVNKRQGQYYLQTWHGTPIKKLLWDLPRKKVPVTYRRIMRKEAAQWDLLLAQTHNAAENLKSGLRYDGEIKIGEYPRNVRLNDEMTDPSLIKRRLGIDSAGKVVLYVPTWREADRVDEDSS